MRRIFVLLPLIPLYALASCEDSDGTTPAIDAGTVPVFDGAGPTDSGTPPVDADAGAAPVTVNVTRRGVPVAGAVVVFGDAAGAVLAVETTNATGAAAHVVPAGSQVTAIMGSATSPSLFTVTDVEPGDVLSAVDATPDPDFGSVDVTVDTLPGGGPAGNLRVSAGPCASPLQPGLPLSVIVYSTCQAGGAFPLLVTAHDTGTGAELGFTHKKASSVFLADGGLVPSPFIVQPTAAWSTTMTNHTVNVSKSPAAQSGGTIYYNEFVGGVAHSSAYGFAADPDAGTQGYTFLGHPGYADFVQTTAQVKQSFAEGAISAIATRSPTPTANTTTPIDLSALLPLISSVTFDVATPARPVVGWTATGSLAAADGTLVVIRWTGEGDGGIVSGSWSIVTPSSKTSVTFPALPPSASGYRPSDSATFGPTPLVVAFEASFIANYAALRAASATLTAPEELYPSTPYGGSIPPLPTAGTLRATAWTHDND